MKPSDSTRLRKQAHVPDSSADAEPRQVHLSPGGVLRPSRRTLFIAGFTTIAVTAIGLAISTVRQLPASHAAGPDAVAQPAASITVTLAPVERAEWAGQLNASGPIEPWQEAVLGAQTSGLRLLEVRANVGDQVWRGQLLARFDTALLLAGQRELQAALSQAEASARQAAANRQRAVSLKDKGGVSQQEVLQYETLAETSAAQVAVVRAQLESRRLLIEQAEVRAPDDGIISARSATVGAVADSGQELFRLIRQGRLEWRGQLTATQLASIAPGQRIDLGLPDGSAASARVRQSAPRLDAQSRMATVYADIAPGSRARAGMYAAGGVKLAARPVLIAPAASVVVRDGRSYVFALQPGGAAPVVKARAVTTGQRNGGAVEIDGVADGELVVVQGAGFLKDGDAVRVGEAFSAGATALAVAAKKGKS